MTKRASEMTPQELAEASAASMWTGDPASQGMGMKITHLAPGTATITMKVADFMSNGQGNCHGGYIFSLADSAFAFACNTYNQITVAQHCSISYLRPGRLGDLLTARATECHRTGRSGIYDIHIINQDGEHIAQFRGHSRTVKGTHVPE